MQICKKCNMPDTRPGSVFEEGVCLACRNYENRQHIDFEEREALLAKICKERIAEGDEYDCVCAVSGGKDSTYIVATLTGLGMKPLLVTVADEFTKTQAGKHNLNNLSERFHLDHLLVRFSPKEFRENTLQDFEKELNPLKWIEEKLYEAPFNIAKKFKIPLVFFGENSGYEYGSDNELSLTHPLSDAETTVYYFFAFQAYNEIEVMKKSKELGFKDLDYFGEWYRQGNIENFTQIDSMGYIAHIWTKFPKFGFQRVSDMTSRMVRKGLLTKEQADLLIRERDYVLDPFAKRDFCSTIGITESYFDKIVDLHANRSILVKDANGCWRRNDLI